MRRIACGYPQKLNLLADMGTKFCCYRYTQTNNTRQNTRSSLFHLCLQVKLFK